MYCKNCNSDIGNFRYCTQCGTDNGIPENQYYTQNANQQYYNYSQTPQADDREKSYAIASMVLGICSLVGIGGLITAILALVFSNKYIKSGCIGSESFDKAGKITGIIALILNILGIVFFILYVIFIIIIAATASVPYYYF